MERLHAGIAATTADGAGGTAADVTVVAASTGGDTATLLLLLLVVELLHAGAAAAAAVSRCPGHRCYTIWGQVILREECGCGGGEVGGLEGGGWRQKRGRLIEILHHNYHNF